MQWSYPLPDFPDPVFEAWDVRRDAAGTLWAVALAGNNLGVCVYKEVGGRWVRTESLGTEGVYLASRAEIVDGWLIFGVTNADKTKRMVCCPSGWARFPLGSVARGAPVPPDVLEDV